MSVCVRVHVRVRVRVNTELDKITDWFNINKLSLNSDKINCSLFRSPKKRSTENTLFITNKPLIQTHATKFLGVIIHQHFTWKDHYCSFIPT